MASNKNLNRAKKNKDDEFYTLYSTIEKISEEYAEVKVKIRWLDDAYKLKLSRMG